MTITTTPLRHVEAFHPLPKAQGPQAALDWLNAGVPHRYSAIYRLNSNSFMNVFLHDKQCEVTPPLLQVLPFNSSFCQFVLRDGTFATHDSTADARLDGHPFQGVMISYHGVPIADDTGEVLETLCHFDVVRQTLPDSEYTLLQGAARWLSFYLPTPTGRPLAR